MEGYLAYKKGSLRFRKVEMKKYYFILQHDPTTAEYKYMLCWYKDEKKQKLKGILNLTPCLNLHTGEHKQLFLGYHFSLKNKPEEEVYHFSAESKPTLERWIATIREAITKDTYCGFIKSNKFMKDRIINLCINKSSLLLCYPITGDIILSWRIAQIVSFLLNETEFSFVICSKCNKCAGRFGLTVSIETGIYIASMLEERASFHYYISNLEREKTASGDVYHMPHICKRSDVDNISLSRTRSLYSSISSKSYVLGTAFNTLLNMPNKEQKFQQSIPKYSPKTVSGTNNISFVEPLQNFTSPRTDSQLHFYRTHSQPVTGISRITASTSFNVSNTNLPICNAYPPRNLYRYPNYHSQINEETYIHTNNSKISQTQANSILHSTPNNTSAHKAIEKLCDSPYRNNSQQSFQPINKDSYQSLTLPRPKTLMPIRFSKGDNFGCSFAKSEKLDCVSFGNNPNKWVLPVEFKNSQPELTSVYGTLPRRRRRLHSDSPHSPYNTSSTFQFPLSSIPVKLKKEPNYSSGGTIIIGETEYNIPRLVPNCNNSTTPANPYLNNHSPTSFPSNDNISQSQTSTPCTSYTVIQNVDPKHTNEALIMDNKKRKRRVITSNKRYSNSSYCSESSSSASSDILLPSLWEDKLNSFQKQALV